MKKHTEEELVKLAKKRLDLTKLKDKHVMLHPEISKWRSKEKPDIQMMRSLNNNGQIGAVIFRKLKKGDTQLLAGARRYAHMKLLGWTWDEILKDIRENVSDREALILALEENILRKDMTLMEEARAVNSLLKSQMKIKEIAKLMGKTPSWVSSRKNLFELPEKVRKRFEANSLEYGYSVPVKKLSHLPEAQKELLDKIVEGKKSSYGGIRKVSDAEDIVTRVLKQVKDLEELLLKYGPCPICKGKDIVKRGWRGEEEHLVCQSEGCGHEWNGVTKEPWEFYELKQNAEKMGITLVEEAPGEMRVTPQGAADIVKREERRLETERKAEEGELPEKFRCKVRLLALLEPLIAGDNIQKLEIRGDKIEIQLIEATPDLYFNGLRKDYKAGEKARIECSGWGAGESLQRNHDHVNTITALDPYGDIESKE